MEIIKVKGNTFCIDTGATYIPFYKINDEEIIMLDTGRKEGERKGIEEAIERNNFKVAAILNSHAHIDHIGNNAYFKDKYNCIIAMPIDEAFICSSKFNLKFLYSSQTLKDIEENYEHMVCKTDIMIENSQDNISLCGINFKIISTPGHSLAHICIITPDNVAYLGDTLLSCEVMKVSKIPYAFIVAEDLKSKAKLYDLRSSYYVLAHKGIYDNIINLIDENIEFYRSRTEKIYEIIEGALTREEILKAVAKSFNIRVDKVFKYAFIERMLRSHIEYLCETGKLTLIVEDGFLKYAK